MKVNVLYYIFFATMLVMTVSGQESDSDSSDSFYLDKEEEDFDLDLKELEELEAPDVDEVGYLRKLITVKKLLNREIQRSHADYHHVDIAGVDGIEMFCPEFNDRSSIRKFKRLQNELRKIATNKRGNNETMTMRCGRGTFDQRCHQDYHLIRVYECEIFCPEFICGHYEIN